MKKTGLMIQTWFALLLGLSSAVPSAATQIEIFGPPGSGSYGTSITALPNGNFVVVDSGYDQTSPAVADVGAVYLYHPGGGLISTLVGSQANDLMGSGGVTVLANGNFVVRSSLWDNGGSANAGAVTWGSAVTGFPGGPRAVVSAANSLVGSGAGDIVGSSGVRVLSNGNYVAISPKWKNGVVLSAGAVTWGNGATGTTGEVSALNSLVGSQAGDQVGSNGVMALSNGNYVVNSAVWDNGGVVNAGAATWGNGATGIVGTVSPANSLVGSQASDQVGTGGVTALSNGNYVVISTYWKNGVMSNAGAVTWGNGATGISGAVSAMNSLVGGQASSLVGDSGVVALSNGNYVVSSIYWKNGLVANAGAATWGNGATGISGAVSPANSLVGSQANDQVGSNGVTTLGNGNYVVSSAAWDNGGVVDAGAATWGNGATGISGAVSPANSLVGGQASDSVGSNGVVALSNGNYVVGSASWDNGGVVDAGAATWGNGATGISGAVSALNSLVGGQASDFVSNNGVVALSNGNYVVSSLFWDHGALVNAGAATWGNGATGLRGAVSPANSLVGGQEGAQVGNSGVTALSNGNYVVSSPFWDDGFRDDAGAVTFGDGRRGVRGSVSTANSLTGGQEGDRVGSGGVTALSNGNYLVSSTEWDNGGVVNAGAVTFGDGRRGVRGLVNTANSLVGSQASDRVGSSSVTALSNGDYVVRSHSWDNSLPPFTDAGAITLGDGVVGTVGPINRAHSVQGKVENSGSSLVFAHNAATGQLIVGQPSVNTVTLLGNFFGATLARSGQPAPGAADVFFARPGAVAVNAPGLALFDSTLSGAGASGGRNRALFGTPPLGGAPGLVMQSGDAISTLGGGLPGNAQATAMFGPVTQAYGRGLFQATVKGSGLNGLNNRLLLADSGAAVWLVRRTGAAVAELGGAEMRSFREVLQSPVLDQITLSYQLRGPAVNGGNDTGLLMLRHDGSVIGNSAVAREGNAAFGGGIFGQFTGQAAVAPFSAVVHFAALVKNGASNGLAIFAMDQDGANQARVAGVGNAAPGAVPGVFSSFPALGNQNGQALFKALLRGVPGSVNEGLWRGSTLLLREGDGITSLPGVLVSGILRFWPARSNQVVMQVRLKGTGVNGGNNQALVLRQNDGQHLVLARTGDSLPGIGTAALRSIVAVDVNPISGAYALLTTLRGSPGRSNLALWGGALGSDTTLQGLRLPVLQLRKGDNYGTPQKPLGVVRSISLKPVVDRTGAGGRGLAQVVGFTGDVAVFILGDRGVTELALLPTAPPLAPLPPL